MEVLLVLAVLLIIGMALSKSNRANNNSGSSNDSIILCHVTGEVLRQSEVNRITSNRAPVTVVLKLSKYKKDRKLNSSLSVGDKLNVGWDTWSEGEDENHHYIVYVTNQDGKMLSSFGPDCRRELAIKYDFIKSCIINSIELEPEPKMEVTVYFN